MMRALLLWLLCCLLIAAGVNPAFSQETTASQAPADKFRSKDHLVVEEVVAGDLVAGGQYVSVQGDVAGDLLAAANELHVAGEVEGSLRSLSTLLTVEGRVRRNVSSVATTIVFAPDSLVRGNVYLYADKISLAGTIAGSVHVYARELVITGRIDGQVTLYPFDGKHRKSSLDVDPGAIVPAGVRVGQTFSSMRAEAPIWKWMMRQSLSALLLYALALGLFRGFSVLFIHPVHTLESRPARILGAGLALIGILFACLLLLLVAGLLVAFLFRPLVVMVFVALLLFVLIGSFYLSSVPVALWLGHLMTARKGSVPASLALGLGTMTALHMLLKLASSLPRVGAIAAILSALGGFLVWLAGSGVLVLGFRRYHQTATASMQDADGGRGIQLP